MDFVFAYFYSYLDRVTMTQTFKEHSSLKQRSFYFKPYLSTHRRKSNQLSLYFIIIIYRQLKNS